MRYVAAYMLSVLSGNKNPSAEDLRLIISSVGIEVDEEKLQLVMEKLHGKNVTDMIEKNIDKLATVSTVSQSTDKDITQTDGDVAEKKPPNDNLEDDDDDDDDDNFFPDIFG